MRENFPLEPSGRFERRVLLVSLASGVLFLAVLLTFSLLIFRSLSSRLVDSVLAQSRSDAEDIARRLASSGRGAPFRVTEKTRDTESYLHSVLKEKKTVEYITVTDRDGRRIFEGHAEGRRAYFDENPTAQLDLPDGTGSRSISTERDYDIAVPIENIGFLHVGVSRAAVASRLESLRGDLVRKTALAAVTALLALAMADFWIWTLVRRNRRLEAARVEDRRLSELGVVAAGLAHEVRNPLHALGLDLRNLEDRMPSERERLAGARSEVRRLDKLVSDFLQYARPAPLRFEEFNLDTLLKEAAALASIEARSHGVAVELEKYPGVSVRWDRSKMQQVLWNLLRNAVEATEGISGAEPVRLSALRAGPGRIEIHVEDRGKGIPAEVLPRIPSLFLSTKKAGTGLGLMVAGRIVREHGGTVRIESEAGSGTVVRIEMPERVGRESEA